MKHLYVLLLVTIASIAMPSYALAQNDTGPLVDPLQTIQAPALNQTSPTKAARQRAALATTIWYVKAGASGTGSSWSDASGDLQAMINQSAEGDQVWIAQGTYKPSTTGLTEPRLAAFSLKNGVSVLGGFTGANGTEGTNTATTRTAIPSSTTLSGDIGISGDASDNSYNVFNHNQNGINNSAVLDGVVITGGNANGQSGDLSGRGRGGGVFNWRASPTLINCQIVGNFGQTGGGLYDQDNSSRIINCSFIGNTANIFGGGVGAYTNTTSFTNCFFSQNNLSGNQTEGGGIFINFSANVPLINCTFVANTAQNGAGLRTGPNNSRYTLTNCLLWNNGGENSISGQATLSYSLIEAGETSYTDGGSNQILTSSPFANATGPQLRDCSPAIDAGNNEVNTTSTDVLGNERKKRIIDIGAAEYQGTPTVISLTNPIVTTAVVGQPFSQSFSASGGQVPYSYSVVSSNLPVELTLSEQGALTGTPTQAGNFSIIVQAQTEQGCTGVSAVYSLSVSYPTPTITGFAASPSPVCAGSPVAFSATVGNYSDSYSYTLTNGVGTPLSGSSTSGVFSQSLTASGSASQSYTLTVSSQGQQATATTGLSVNPLPTPSLSSSGTLTCGQPSVNLVATGGDQGASYRFSGPGQSGQPVSSSAISVSASGTYSVTVTNAGGCSATATTEVTGNTSPPQNVTLTNSGPLSFTNTNVTLTATTGQGYSYSFSQGAAQQGSSNKATVNTAGVYSVTVTRQDNGCTATASTTVLGGNNPTVCRGGTAVINVAVSGSPIKYEWYKNSLTSPKIMETPQLFRGTATSSLTLINAQTNTQGNFYLKTTDQAGAVTIYGPYRLTVDASCRAREIAQLETPLQVELAPNPIQQGRLRAVVKGAEGRALSVELLDLSGKPIRQQHWQQADAQQLIDWDMQLQGSGLYLLQVVSEASSGLPAQRQSVKVVKP
ncbi:choice-of-anchor Q domain-containing protein [Spirosoma fluminis]